MQKVVALCLLRLLPRGGKNFRLWFGKRLCRAEFERQTHKLRAGRVFMMRPLETRKEGFIQDGAKRIDPFTVSLFSEMDMRVALCKGNKDDGIGIERVGSIWRRGFWRRKLH